MGRPAVTSMAAPSSSPHRTKHPSIPFNLFNACVAKPLTRKEWKAHPKAKQAVQDEWDKLRATPGGGCWDEDHPMELRDVLRLAREAGEEAHWATLFELCVIENEELPEDHLLRKYKGRVVVGGHNVKDQN